MGEPQAQADDQPEAAGPGRLGTFAGVFTPSILTILGIILFLRLGYVTGAGGLVRALVIILAANAISVLTSVSLSAIATNLRVQGGGDYYLISRTLGVEYGGALGLVLYIAQSVSVAFYAIGFAEAVVAVIGGEHPRLTQVVAALAVVPLFVLAWLGADWATRFQYVVMAVLFAALIAFFVGGIAGWDTSLLFTNLTGSPVPDGSGVWHTLPFWTIFALFFPAVTGFTQGVSMSGDLKDPGRSLPLGTFLAVGLSMLVYLAVAVLFAATLRGDELVADYGAMRRVSSVPMLVDAGVVAATLSSALASFLGAPRILQSLASDRVFPLLGFFAKGHGATNNPRRGAVLSLIIALATIALGDLNVVAPVVSMFFLISYGLLNYATYVEARANSPSFRPRFRFFHERLSLAGAVGCLGAMLAIQPVAAIVAVALLFAVHYYIAGTVAVDRWADSGRSQRFQRVRENLLAIAGEPEHARSWRPVILAFSNDPARRERLLRFASWIEGRSGLTTVVRLIEGGGPRARQQSKEMEKELWGEIHKQKLPAFPRAIVTPDLDNAASVVLQAYGLGPLRANTVLINYLRKQDGQRGSTFAQRLRQALRFGCNVVILHGSAQDFAAIEQLRAEDRRIDVWHRDNATGRLMLMLAYLMTRHPTWEDAPLRLLAAAPKDGDVEKVRGELQKMLDEVRIPAEPEIVDTVNGAEVVRRSAGASIVFLPFRLGDEGPASVFGDAELAGLLPELGIGVLTLAAQDIELDTQPEAGLPGKIAEAVDAVSSAERARRAAEKEETAVTQKIEELRERLEKAREAGEPETAIDELVAEMERCGEELEKARRRVAKARAKGEAAAAEAETLKDTTETT